MKNTLKALILLALNTDDQELYEELTEHINDILSNLEETINCPSNWREIQEELKEDPDCSNFEFKW